MRQFTSWQKSTYKPLMWLFWLGISGVFMACPPKENPAPQKRIQAAPQHPLPASLIQVPIELPTVQLQRLVERALPHPLLQATTKKFVLHLTPRRPPEERNWFQRAATPLLEWVDETIDASAQFAYTVELADWTLHFEDDRVELELLLDLDGNVQLDNALKWEGTKHAFAQTIACPTQVRLHLEGQLQLTEEATLQLQLHEDQGGQLTITRFCSNQPLKAIDLPELLRPSLQPLQKDLTRAINKALTQQLQRLLDSDQAQQQLSFQGYLDRAADYLAQAYPIQDSLWLLPQAEALVLSPPVGRGQGLHNHLQLAVGILAHPTLVLQREAPKAVLPSKQGFLQKPYQPQATLYLRGQWALEHAAEQVQHYLSDYMEQHYASYGYAIGKVRIYPQDSLAVVGIELLRRATGKPKAWLYLKGVPRYDAGRQEVYLSDLRFTAESKDLLLHVAKWWRQAELLHRLEQNTRWDAAPYFKQAQEQLRYWQVVQEQGSLEGRFRDLQVAQVWISQSYFEVSLRAKGTLKATINWEAW